MTGQGGFLLQCRADGRIERVLNDGLGLVGAEWLGRPFTALIAPGSLAKALEFFTRITAQGAQYYWEMPVAATGRNMVFMGAGYDGGIAVAASHSPDGLDTFVEEFMQVTNEQANVIRGMVAGQRRRSPNGDGALEDMTRLNIEFANMQREIARKNVELARANERKSMILGMAAHDLRNPLQVISGFAEYLQVRAADRLDESEQRFISHILESSARMLAIIEDVLVLSRAETGKLILNRSPTDLSELVRHCGELHAMIAERKGIAVAVSVDGPAVLDVDGAKLAQVLDNLISNAIKFAPAGTCVSVTLTGTAKQVAVAVRDQGQGIPADELPRLFQPFARTSVRSTAGEPSTGLGLAISKSIVEGHGGSLTVDSAVGRGSAFVMTLPRH